MFGWRAKRSIAVINCMEYNADVERVTAYMHAALPKSEVVFFPDCRSGSLEYPRECRLFPMTDQTLDKLKLTKGRPGKGMQNNVGWACADYAFYHLLSEKWDYLWLIEPDVGMNEAGIKLLNELDKRDDDLIGYRASARPGSWPWGKPFLDVTGYSSFYGVFFPLVRVSRRLAEECYRLRKVTSEINDADSESPIPHCEALVASVAYNNLAFKVCNLKDDYAEAFKHFNDKQHYLLSQVDSIEAPNFVHPVRSLSEVKRRSIGKISKSIQGSGLSETLELLPKPYREEIVLAALEKLYG